MDWAALNQPAIGVYGTTPDTSLNKIARRIMKSANVKHSRISVIQGQGGGCGCCVSM